MTRTFCLMIAAALFAAGCGDDKTPESNDGNGNDPGAGIGGLGSKKVALPKDMPADVPIYPGARTKNIDDSQRGHRNVPLTSIILETTDALAEVRSFYKKKIGEHSWKIDKEFPSSFTASKGKRTLNVWFMEMPGKRGSVSMRVTYSRPK